MIQEIKKIRVLGIALGSMQLASSRIRCYSLLPYLPDVFEVQILPANQIEQWTKGLFKRFFFEQKLNKLQVGKGDIVFLQKAAFPWSLRVAEWAKKRSCFLVYDIDDVYASPEGVIEKKIFELADCVTVDTEERAAFVRSQSATSVEVVSDGLDYMSGCLPWAPSSYRGPIRQVATFGWDYSCQAASPFFEWIDLPNQKKAYITNRMAMPQYRFIQWRYESFLSELTQFDLCVLSHTQDDVGSLKSNNRLLVSLFAGIPTLVSDTPAFRKTYNAIGLEDLVCKTPEDVRACIDRLNSEPGFRDRMIQKGMEFVKRTAHPRLSAERLSKILLSLRS